MTNPSTKYLILEFARKSVVLGYMKHVCHESGNAVLAHFIMWFQEDWQSELRHLVIDSKHPRHGWMAAYQLLFFGRLKYFIPVLDSVFRRKRIGLITTFKARLNKEYYR